MPQIDCEREIICKSKYVDTDSTKEAHKICVFPTGPFGQIHHDVCTAFDYITSNQVSFMLICSANKAVLMNFKVQNKVSKQERWYRNNFFWLLFLFGINITDNVSKHENNVTCRQYQRKVQIIRRTTHETCVFVLVTRRIQHYILQVLSTDKRRSLLRVQSDTMLH